MFFKKLKFKYRMIKRIGAFIQAREKGLSEQEAQMYMDKVYPPTQEQIIYEEYNRQFKKK